MVELKTNFRQLIKDKAWISLKYSLNEYDSIQIAELIEESSEKDEIILFRLLSRIQAKEVFQQLSHAKQEQIIEGLAQNQQELSDLLNDLEPDDRIAIFEELPGKVTQQLMQWLSPGERGITSQLLGYPEDSIGRLMTPEYVAVKPRFTVGKLLSTFGNTVRIQKR